MARRLRLLATLAVLAAAPVARAERPSSVPAGSTRAGDLVVLGRGADVDGVLEGTLVAVGGDIRISGRVDHDVIAFGGDVTFVSGGQVRGDVLAVGGAVTAPAGATSAVGGRVLTVGALEAAFAAELQTSPLSATRVSGLLLAFRLVLLFLWLVAGLLLLRFVPRPVSGAASLASGRLAVVAALGSAAFLSGALLSAFLLLTLPATAALVVTGVLLALLGAAKVFGLAAVFLALGRRLTLGVRRGSPLFGDPAALALGLAVLGLVSLVPMAGPVVWSVASLLGIGAALLAVSRTGAPRPAL